VLILLEVEIDIALIVAVFDPVALRLAKGLPGEPIFCPPTIFETK
jgi:hypothetical protein